MTTFSMLKDYMPLRNEIKLFEFEKSTLNLVIAAVCGFFLLSYLYGIVNFLMYHHSAYNVTRDYPWGLLMVMYEFFVGLAMGLGMLGASILFFNLTPLRFLARRTILFGLLSLISGFSVFLFEIGHPITMVIYVALSGNFTSTLFWLGVFYPLFMLFSVLTFLGIGSKYEKAFALGLFVFALCSIMTAGSIFGFLNSTAFANGIYYPIQFVLSSIAMGILFLFLIAGVQNKSEKASSALILLGKFLGAITALLLIMSISRYLVGVYGGLPERVEPISYIYSSSRYILWELFFALLLPLIVLVVSKNYVKWLTLISVPALIGYFVSRYNLVDGLQLYPKLTLKTGEYQAVKTLITHYVPSMTEIALSLGGLGVAIMCYYIAEKVFNLDATEGSQQ